MPLFAPSSPRSESAERYVVLAPGLRLTVQGPARAGRSGTYEAVIRYVSELLLRIDHPRRGDVDLEVRVGERLDCTTLLHGRIHAFDAVVRAIDEGASSLILEPPSEVRRIERRRYYRLPVTIVPRHAALLDEDDEEVQRIDARLLDISGGGAQVRSRQPLATGARVKLVFALDGESDPLEVYATVLAAEQPDPRSTATHAHARFDGLGRRTEERIVRFIYKQQVLLSQRRAA